MLLSTLWWNCSKLIWCSMPFESKDIAFFFCFLLLELWRLFLKLLLDSEVCQILFSLLGQQSKIMHFLENIAVFLFSSSQYIARILRNWQLLPEVISSEQLFFPSAYLFERMDYCHCLLNIFFCKLSKSCWPISWAIFILWRLSTSV